MNKRIILLICLTVFITACAETKDQMFLENSTLCLEDTDCICGGVDTKTKECFIGNTIYYEVNVDKDSPCPDFCTGFAGNLETKCKNNKCTTVPIQKPCQEDAKICEDGTTVVRSGPDCTFDPCPGEEECQTDNDCIPSSCCHPDTCTTKDNAPDCTMILCSQECAQGTMDCQQGGCICKNNKCAVEFY